MLEDWQKEVIALFSQTADLMGLRKSVGSIYGLFFCSEEALSIAQVQQALGISKGSAVQGLQVLRQLGAVRSVSLEGERSEYFTAEVKLKKILAGFLQSEIKPGLDRGEGNLSELLEREDVQASEFAQSRVLLMQAWVKQVRKLLPVVNMVLKG